MVTRMQIHQQVGHAGLVGWRKKRGRRRRPAAAKHGPVAEDQVRAFIGGAFFVLSVYYVVATIVARRSNARARLDLAAVAVRDASRSQSRRVRSSRTSSGCGARRGRDLQRRVDVRHAVQRRAEECDPGGERGEEPGPAHAASQAVGS